jgi:hypothetical protein
MEPLRTLLLGIDKVGILQISNNEIDYKKELITKD